MKKKTKIITGLALAGLCLALYVDRQCFVAKEEKVILKSEKIKKPIKITQITDFHSNAIKNLDEVLENIQNFSPDLVILTGDIIDYGTEDKIERSVYFLEKLMFLNIKTYYITGNHEEAGANLDKFLSEIERLGITYLKNEGERLDINGNKVYLYGTSMFDFSYENYKADDESVNIILSHFSKNARDNYQGSEDFIFSGHTHGGQVRLPIVGGLVAPGEGFFPEYDKGAFKFNDSIIYIDSGLGNTFLPLRFMDQIQYSNIVLAPVV